MKRLIAAWLCALLSASACGACAAGVPEDTLHQAIMTLTWNDAQGECWVEGHVVLGTEETADTATVYALVSCQNYGFLAGLFTDTGGGFIAPIVCTFDRLGDGYRLRDIQQPEDGGHYDASLKSMMPQECLDRLWANEAENRSAIQRQMHTQAQSYLSTIGRHERVGDWRTLNLQLSNKLVAASNLTSCFSPPYPLWIAEKEQLENAERYLYRRAWQADGLSGDTQTYAASHGDTMVYDGATGTETLTKRRQTDGALVETIVIKVERDHLFVTYVDEGGSKAYQFPFDGQTYHQPSIIESGACRISYPEFDIQAMALPK